MGRVQNEVELRSADKTLAQVADQSIFSSDEIEEARQAILRSLHAQRSVRSDRDADGSILYEVVDDSKTQVQAAALVLAYAHGTPVQRMAVQHRGAMADQEEKERQAEAIARAFKKDPEALRSIAESYIGTLQQVQQEAEAEIDGEKRQKT